MLLDAGDTPRDGRVMVRDLEITPRFFEE